MANPVEVNEIKHYIGVIKNAICGHEVRYAEIYRKLAKDLAEKSQGEIPMYRHNDIRTDIEFMQREVDAIAKLEAQLSGLQQALFILE